MNRMHEIIALLVALAFATQLRGQDIEPSPLDLTGINLEQAVRDDTVTEDLRKLLKAMSEGHRAFERDPQTAGWREALLDCHRELAKHHTGRSVILQCFTRMMICQTIAVELQSIPNAQRLRELDRIATSIALRPSQLQYVGGEKERVKPETDEWDEWIDFVRSSHGMSVHRRWDLTQATTRVAKESVELGRLIVLEDVALSPRAHVDAMLIWMLGTESTRAVNIRGAIAYLQHGGSTTEFTGDSANLIPPEQRRSLVFPPLEMNPVRTQLNTGDIKLVFEYDPGKGHPQTGFAVLFIRNSIRMHEARGAGHE